MATFSMGTKLLIGANSIAELTEISGLELSADTLETTTLDNSGNYRTFVQGMKDAGEVSMSGFFNPNDTNGQKALYDLYVSGALTSMSIVFPSAMGASWTFNGIVTGVTTGASMEDLVSFECTVKLSGVPSLNVTASANLSNLAVSATGGTLAPTFTGGVYNYLVTGITATSGTVTATLAGASLKLYIDDVYVQDLTSGSASSAIALTLNVTKKVTIIAQETGKAQKIYEVLLLKTA